MASTRKRGETYARLKGKKFGFHRVQNESCDVIYNGSYYDPDIKKKQYSFIYVNDQGEIKGSAIMDYRSFREILKSYWYWEKMRSY